jgi:hypothetical protein
MSRASLPRWAVLPAAVKLVASCLRHPNSGKVVYVDVENHKVSVESVNGRFTTKDSYGPVATTDNRPGI